MATATDHMPVEPIEPIASAAPSLSQARRPSMSLGDVAMIVPPVTIYATAMLRPRRALQMSAAMMAMFIKFQTKPCPNAVR